MITAQIALRNVFRHKTRSLITVSAIAFGCTAVIFVGGFFEDILYKMRESYIKAHTGHLQIYKQGFFEKGSGKPFDYLIDHPEQLIPLISSIDGVSAVTQRLQFAGLISTGETTLSCFGQGVEPEREPAIRLTGHPETRKDLASLSGAVIEDGEPLDRRDPYGIIVGKGLAAGMDVAVGTNLVLLTHTVGGSINALDVTMKGSFFTSSKAFDDYAVRLPLSTAQQLLQTTAVQSLVVMLKKTEDTSRAKHAIERVVADQHLDLELKTWDELSDFYVKTKAFLERLFMILKLVVAIIVILSIYNTMNMAVLERTSEIGTIMALGTKRSGVLRLFLYEGAALGILGGGLGLLVGSSLTLLVKHIGIPMPPPPGATLSWLSEPIVVPSVLAFAFFLSVVTALISSCCPAYKASRLEIAEALRRA